MADDAPGLDYVVVKPDRYDFGNGEVLLEHGTIIPGAIAESWGNGLMHLINLGRLSPIPAVEEDHPRKYDVTAEPPVIEAAAPGTTVEPTREDLIDALELAAQVVSLQDELVSKDAEIADLNEKLEAAQAATTEEPTIEVGGDDEVLALDSAEYLAHFDSLDSAELVAEISTWGTGDGSDESPAVLKPSLETITGLRDHEAATGNRQDVLDALEVQLAPPEAEQPPADEKPFPQHKAAGVFILSDGSEVRGKKAAIDAQAALDAAVDAPGA